MSNKEYMRRYMKAYLKRKPEKARARNEYAKKKYKVAHPEIIRFCKRCGKQLESRRRIWCCKLCGQRFKQGYPRPKRPKRPIEQQRAYEKAYWSIPENRERKKAALRATTNRKRIKRIKQLEKKLKLLKFNQERYERRY